MPRFSDRPVWILLVPALVLAVLVAVQAGLPATARPFPRFGAGCARSDFRSGDSNVRAELCSPSGAGPSPAVVVLHGCGGFSTFDHRLVAELPRFGIATLDVDFFGPTPPPGSRGFCGEPQALEAAFPAWQREVLDAAAHLARLPGVDQRRVGVVGWSLGAALALAAAETQPALRPLRALALFSTGAFGFDNRLSSLPPTLLLSGGVHDAIPVADTRLLYQELKSAGVAAQLYVYPNGTHQWAGPQGTAGIVHAAVFLKQYLG